MAAWTTGAVAGRPFTKTYWPAVSPRVLEGSPAKPCTRREPAVKPTTVITRFRILAITGAVLGILLAVILARMQFAGSGKAGAEEPLAIETSTYSTTISAIRGEILDRNGIPLISNEQVYSIRFNRTICIN